jgi:hypothetical protein
VGKVGPRWKPRNRIRSALVGSDCRHKAGTRVVHTHRKVWKAGAVGGAPDDAGNRSA